MRILWSVGGIVLIVVGGVLLYVECSHPVWIGVSFVTIGIGFALPSMPMSGRNKLGMVLLCSGVGFFCIGLLILTTVRYFVMAP